MEPPSNRDQERQKYYTLLQFGQGDHPPSSSTSHHGQVQKRTQTQLSDTPEDGPWSVTRGRDRT